MTSTSLGPSTVGPAPQDRTVDRVRAERRRRTVRRTVTVAVLVVAILAAFYTSLAIGHRIYSPEQIGRVILGQKVPGASFTVGRLRLPRAVLAVLVGCCFGLGGVTFQTMLRNPLASPDIIGISSGASAAAVVGIVLMGLSGPTVSVVAIVAGLAVACVIYLLSYRKGVAGTRLILIGIGVAAMLDSVTSYVLSRAGQWDLQEAMRWLTGSLNGSDWNAVVPVLVCLCVAGPVLLLASKDLTTSQLGDDTAAALGVRVQPLRLIVIIAAVALVAFATAAAGPIAFVAFLSGPIASRIVGPGASLLVPSALVGALLVVVSDLVGQWAIGTRFPVGVVTGVLGAPYLIYLVIRTQRAGGSL